MSYQDTYPIVKFQPTGEKTDLASVLKDDFPATDAIDWFWRNFVNDGVGFRESLVKPLIGDYDRIAENGRAWRHIEKQINNLSHNLTDNTAQLIPQYWDGKAAKTASDLVEKVWSPALMGMEVVAQSIAIGYEKFTEGLLRLARSIIKILEAIIKKITKLARRLLPGGFIAGLIEWIIEGFDKFPYMEEVEEIIDRINEAKKLLSIAHEIINMFKRYLNIAEHLWISIKHLTHVNSNTDLLTAAKEISRGARKADKAVGNSKKLLDKTKREYNKVLDKADEVTGE